VRVAVRVGRRHVDDPLRARCNRGIEEPLSGDDVGGVHRRVLGRRDADLVAAGDMEDGVGAVDRRLEGIERHRREVALHDLAADLSQRVGVRR